MASVTNLKVAFQNNSDSTLYATWSWGHKHTKEYSIEWQYDTGNGVWFIGNTSTETRKQSTYSFPSNAKKVRVLVKPISTTYKKKVTKKNKKGKKTTTLVETHYWTANKKASNAFSVLRYRIPATPSAPTVSMDGYKMSISLEVSDSNTAKIEFEIRDSYSDGDKRINSSSIASKTQVKSRARISSGSNSNGSISGSPIIGGGNQTIHAMLSGLTIDIYVRSAVVNVVNNLAIYELMVTMAQGTGYRVRARGISAQGTNGEWSGWSSLVQTPPEKVYGVQCAAAGKDSVKVNWNSAIGAKTYTIEYTSQQDYFDAVPDQVSSKDNINATYTYINGLDRSKRWYFRVKAVNESGTVSESWSDIVSCVIGTKPNPPSTWSSVLTATTDETVMLYWIHNTEDGSSQVSAEIELINDSNTEIITVPNDRSDEDKDKTSSYSLQTSKYPDGAELKWRVRTKGVTDEYGDWSIQRTIHIYTKPELEVIIATPKSDTTTDAITEITKLPFCIICNNRSKGQRPIGYYITIAPTTTYVTLNNSGEEIFVNEGETIYSKYIDDLLDTDNPDLYTLVISAGDINLQNDITYKITVNMTLNSGLYCDKELEVPVNIEYSGAMLEAEISVDGDALVTYISPYCIKQSESEAVEITQEEDGEEPTLPNADELDPEIMLAVYRREYDGSFTLISEKIENNLAKTIVDPHPSLDYARYRIVGTNTNTGEITYHDIPVVPVDEKSIVIQWGEKWQDFDRNVPDATDDAVISGSMLVLEYDIKVAESYSRDVTLVEYIGRRSPVSYYGTQIGEGGSWSVDIPCNDTDTIYALRRLGTYQGDVYIREPSGLGYWASVSVSMNHTRKDKIIPVTLDVTRVEGDGI